MTWTGYKSKLTTPKVETEWKNSLLCIFPLGEEMQMSENCGNVALPSLKSQLLLIFNASPTNPNECLELESFKDKISFLESFSYSRETVELKIFKSDLGKTLNNILKLTLFGA